MNLQNGRWYAIGFKELNSDIINWFSAPIYQWNGSCWLDENGDQVSLYDCDLRMIVADDAADEYALQN